MDTDLAINNIVAQSQNPLSKDTVQKVAKSVGVTEKDAADMIKEHLGNLS